MGDHRGSSTFFGEWWQQIVLRKKKEEVCFTAMVAWNLWNNRNDIVWNGKNNSYDWILRQAQFLLGINSNSIGESV